MFLTPGPMAIPKARPPFSRSINEVLRDRHANELIRQALICLSHRVGLDWRRILCGAAMSTGLIYSFVTLFVIIDPVGTATIFAGLTHDWTPAERRESAKRGVIVAGLLLLAFAFGGEALLRALGISLAALRIAGGILL